MYLPEILDMFTVIEVDNEADDSTYYQLCLLLDRSNIFILLSSVSVTLMAGPCLPDGANTTFSPFDRSKSFIVCFTILGNF